MARVPKNLAPASTDVSAGASRGRVEGSVRKGIVTPDTAGLAGAMKAASARDGIIDNVQPNRLDERVFHSRAANLVMQVDSPPPESDPRYPGKVIFPRSKTIRFRNGEFRTSDPFLVEFIVNAKGYGVQFWDAVERRKGKVKSRYDDLIAEIAVDPDLMEMFKQDLSAADFSVLDAIVAKRQRNEEADRKAS